MQFANATVRYVLTNQFGEYNETIDSWTTGLYKQLVHSEVDIGATGFAFTPQRVSWFQYIAAPIKTESFFFFRMPNLSYTDNVFILPFDTLVWYCFLALIALLILFLTASVCIEWRLPIDDENDKVTSKWFCLFNDFGNTLLLIELHKSGNFASTVNKRCCRSRAGRILSTRISRKSTKYNRSCHNGSDVHCANVFLYELLGEYCCIAAVAIEENPKFAAIV